MSSQLKYVVPNLEELLSSLQVTVNAVEEDIPYDDNLCNAAKEALSSVQYFLALTKEQGYYCDYRKTTF